MYLILVWQQFNAKKTRSYRAAGSDNINQSGETDYILWCEMCCFEYFSNCRFPEILNGPNLAQKA